MALFWTRRATKCPNRWVRLSSKQYVYLMIIKKAFNFIAGNVIDPKDIIEGGPNQKEKPAYGADTLRLWISGVDYTGDVCVGTNIIKQV